MDRLTVAVFVIIIIWLVGIVGNVLSAIVWLRRQVSSKNSSAVYLAAIAINDIIHPLTLVPIVFLGLHSWAHWIVTFIHLTSYTLEPLLVLGFSVERLFAIYRPLQVRFCHSKCIACIAWQAMQALE